MRKLSLFILFFFIFAPQAAFAQGYHHLHTAPQRYGGMTAEEVAQKGLQTIVTPYDLLCSIQGSDMRWTGRKYLRAGEPVVGRWLNDEIFLVMYVVRCGNRVEDGITIRFPKQPVVETPPCEQPPAQQPNINITVNVQTQQGPASQALMGTGGQRAWLPGGSMNLQWYPSANGGNNTFNVQGGTAISNSQSTSSANSWSQSQSQNVNVNNNTNVNGDGSAGAGSANGAGSQTQNQ